MQRKYRLILRLSALLLMVASPGAHARGYASTGKCGIYPRLAITSPSGTCVGLMADDAHGLRFPRRVLEIEPGRIWVLDMGNWMPQVGQLIELAPAARCGDPPMPTPRPGPSKPECC
jgi:hypothetical protein